MGASAVDGVDLVDGVDVVEGLRCTPRAVVATSTRVHRVYSVHSVHLGRLARSPVRRIAHSQFTNLPIRV